MPKRKPVSGTVRLTLTINGTHYLPLAVTPHPMVAKRAWRLRKADGTEYDVHVDEHGAHCTCPDFIYARDHKDVKGCKHIAGLRAAGLLP